MLLVSPQKQYMRSYVEFCVEYKKNSLADFFLNNQGVDVLEDMLADERRFKKITDIILNELKENEAPKGGNRVPALQFWLIDNETVVGVGNIRQYLTTALELFGGHIGYGVKVGFWGRGYGTALLHELLKELSRFGVKNALLTCDKTNSASRKVMEKNGGKLLDTVKQEINGIERTALRILIDTGLILNKVFTGKNHTLIYQVAQNSKAAIVPVKAVDEYGRILSYYFNIIVNGEIVGWLVFRVADEPLLYYDGNVGYFIQKKHRGNGYAVEACRLLAANLKNIGISQIFITCDSDNHPSRRICEKLGAKLLEIVEVKAEVKGKIKCRYLRYL